MHVVACTGMARLLMRLHACGCMHRDGEAAHEAASALAEMGIAHLLYVVKGGLKAWQVRVCMARG